MKCTIFKKTLILAFLILVLLPINKINAQDSNIRKVIGQNTPNFLASPIISAIDTIESVRLNISNASSRQMEILQVEINGLGATKNSNSLTPQLSKTQISDSLKPFVYFKLFLFTFLSYCLDNKLIFYGAALVLIFLIIHYLWSFIFF